MNKQGSSGCCEDFEFSMIADDYKNIAVYNQGADMYRVVVYPLNLPEE